MSDWKLGEWHLLVQTWDRNGLSFSVDGGPPGRMSFPTPLGAEQPGEFRVRLYGANEDTFVYDEFLLLDVPLTPDEIRWMYDQGLKKSPVP